MRADERLVGGRQRWLCGGTRHWTIVTWRGSEAAVHSPRQNEVRVEYGAQVSAVDTVEAEVRELVRRRGLDPIEDRAAVRRLVDEVIADYDERALTSTLAPLPDSRTAARAVYDAVAGFGPLQRHLDDPTVEEIWINEPGRVFIARRGSSELTTTILNDGQVRDLVEKMLKTTGRRVDLSTPFVDANLPNHAGR
ncbi:MAG: Flp pilus assembly complex ATPase component TadA [Frankiaceae bacterium]|nr:Flp pilus assembly complex ATPase component TadA [Frankiaceae bacterium]